MTLLSPGPFFRVFPYDNLWLYHIDAFGKWSALLFLFCFRLLSNSGTCTFILLRVLWLFLKDPADEENCLRQEAKRNIWGWLLQWLHSLKAPVIAFYQDRAVSGLYVLNLSPLEVGILLEMNLLFYILLWQPGAPCWRNGNSFAKYKFFLLIFITGFLICISTPFPRVRVGFLSTFFFFLLFRFSWLCHGRGW